MVFSPANAVCRHNGLIMATPEQVLQRVDFKIIRKLDGLLQGDYRSLFYGNGIDFADLREYQPEDDVRFIDWNVTARMDTTYVRKYHEDREITAWFLLDLSPSVDFGAGGPQKRAVLTDFVTTLARMLTRHGNRVGALFLTDKVAHTVPAGGGRMHVLRLINDLQRFPRLQKSPMTNLKPLLEAAANGIKRRSLIFVISDFISPPGWEHPLSLLNRRHEVLTVRLVDPRESTLPDIGIVVMQDAETGEQLIVDTHDKRFRQRFADAAQHREKQLAASFKTAGVDALTLSTDEDLIRAVVRFAALRRNRKPR
jgi:uncharacterized protein (DUF58 family)